MLQLYSHSIKHDTSLPSRELAKVIFSQFSELNPVRHDASLAYQGGSYDGLEVVGAFFHRLLLRG
jgi:hypothetical protein